MPGLEKREVELAVQLIALTPRRFSGKRGLERTTLAHIRFFPDFPLRRLTVLGLLERKRVLLQRKVLPADLEVVAVHAFHPVQPHRRVVHPRTRVVAVDLDPYRLHALLLSSRDGGLWGRRTGYAGEFDLGALGPCDPRANVEPVDLGPKGRGSQDFGDSLVVVPVAL